MIAVDANILVYARRGDAPLHARAVEALHELSESDEAWALPVFSVLQPMGLADVWVARAARPVASALR